MKTMAQYIHEATIKRNDILITDEDVTLEQHYDGDWYVVGEVDWCYNNEEIEALEVAKVEELEEGITIIHVVGYID